MHRFFLIYIFGVLNERFSSFKSTNLKLDLIEELVFVSLLQFPI